MELNHLKHFYYVVKYGGFTRAAEQLRIQQPVVSRTIKVLEQGIGFKLLERNGRKVILTSMGKEIYKRSCSIFSEMDDLERLVKNETLSGIITFGASEPIASYLVPDLITDLLKKNPLLQPSLYSAPALTLVEMIEEGQLEFGFFFHVPESNYDLAVENIKMVEFHYVVSKLALSSEATLSRFIGSREIDDFRIKEIPVVTALAKKVGPLTRVVSTNNLTAQKALALAGVGVALLPDFMVKDELRRGRLKSLFPNEKFEFALKIVTRQSTYLSKGAKILRASMQSKLT